MAFAGDPVVAEEALQETWIHAIEAAGRFDAARPLVPWLVGVLKNKCREARRRERRVPDPRRVEALGSRGHAEAEPERRDARETARAAIETLAEPYRAVALLRWVYGMEEAPEDFICRGCIYALTS